MGSREVVAVQGLSELLRDVRCHKYMFGERSSE